jgi:hypothetical protein
VDDGGEGGDANAQRGERLAGVGAVDESEGGRDGDYRFHGGVGVMLWMGAGCSVTCGRPRNGTWRAGLHHMADH